MYNYTVTWRGFKGARRQALPAAVRAKNKYGALAALAGALKDNATVNMPKVVILTALGGSRSKVAGVVAWRAVGPR